LFNEEDCMYMRTREGLGQIQIAYTSREEAEWGCPKLERLKVGKVPVWSLRAYMALFFKAGMTIDADGAPNAYHPQDIGLDDLKNAGYPAKPGSTPWGIVTNAAGNPVIQGAADPFPGYFVSGTSLGDSTRLRTDPRRYVDSTQIPYIALPKALADKLSVKLGDFAAVINGKNRRLSYAVFADIGPAGKLGEGSIALAQALGHDPFVAGKVRKGIAGDVVYVVFPGFGNGKPRPILEINAEGAKLFKDWGGMMRIDTCFPEYLLKGDFPAPPSSTRYA
jgi:hypothetical protein